MTATQQQALQKLANNQSNAADFKTALAYLLNNGFNQQDAEVAYDKFYETVKFFKSVGLMQLVKQPIIRK